MLCTLVLNGVTEGMRGLKWTLGRDYENVTVSINPAETPALAKAKKENYLEQYERPGTSAGWHFLTGKQENITALAQAVGFNYRFDPQSKQFIHTAGTFLCTPDGRISRVLYGIEYEPQTFRLGLLEAAQGKIGNSIDQLVLYCFHYDSNAGRYGLAAQHLMQIGGAASVAILGVFLITLRVRESRRRAHPAAGGART
jgi:protein SCO1/2